MLLFVSNFAVLAVRCWQGLHPPTQAVSDHVDLHFTKLGEVLIFRCEGNTTHYSDVILGTLPEIYCGKVTPHNSNSDRINMTWLCWAMENTTVRIRGFTSIGGILKTLMEFDVLVHNLEGALRATPAPCTPPPPESTTTSPSEDPNVDEFHHNTSMDEPTTSEAAITTAREYPLYVVLCALFIPLILVGGVVTLLIVVVVKCPRKNKVQDDPESVNGGKDQATQEADETFSSNQGDTSSDVLPKQ